MKRKWKLCALVLGLALWTTSCGSGSGSNSNSSNSGSPAGMFSSFGQQAPTPAALQSVESSLQQYGVVFIMIQNQSGSGTPLVPAVDSNYWHGPSQLTPWVSSALRNYISQAQSYIQPQFYNNGFNNGSSSNNVDPTTAYYTQIKINLCQLLLTGNY